MNNIWLVFSSGTPAQSTSVSMSPRFVFSFRQRPWIMLARNKEHLAACHHLSSGTDKHFLHLVEGKNKSPQLYTHKHTNPSATVRKTFVLLCHFPFEYFSNPGRQIVFFLYIFLNVCWNHVYAEERTEDYLVFDHRRSELVIRYTPGTWFLSF